MNIASSTGPDSPILHRFLDHWRRNDSSRFETTVDYWVPGARYCSCWAKLAANHQRDDYNELLELVIIFLGGAPTQEIHFIALEVLFIQDVEVPTSKMFRSLSNWSQLMTEVFSISFYLSVIVRPSMVLNFCPVSASAIDWIQKPRKSSGHHYSIPPESCNENEDYLESQAIVM